MLKLGRSMSIPGIRGVFLWMLLSAPLGYSGDVQDKDRAEEPAEEQSREEERRFVVTVEEAMPQVALESSVATKIPASILQTPASVSVVTHPLFKSQDAVVLGDALANVAGVNVQTNFGVHDLFFVRGYDSLAGGLVLYDGAAEPEATFYNLYNVEQVEVLRGPGAFLYGGNPLASVVNMTRKQPQSNRFWQAAGTLGAFDTFRGQMDLNLGSGDSPLAFRLNLMGEDSNGYRDGLDHHQTAVNPALRWRVGGRTFVTLNFEYVNNEFSPDAGLPLVGSAVADVPRTRSYASPFDISSQEIYRFRFDWETQLNDRVTFRNKFYHADLDWGTNGTLLLGVFPNREGDPEVQRVLNLLEDRQKLFGNQSEWLFTLRTGPVRHELMAGLEVSRLGDRFTLDVALLPGISLYEPLETAREPVFILPGQSLGGDSRSWTVAPYFLDRLILSEKVQLFLGGRMDAQRFEDGINGTSFKETRFNPMVGIVVSPQPTLSLYASGGTAFSPPSTLVIDDRKPEESGQFEFGIKKHFLDGKMIGSLAVYRLDKGNIAIPDENGITRRLGDQRSAGLELESTFTMSPFWHAFINYAYNDSELTRYAETGLIGYFPPTLGTVDLSGNSAPFSPQHVLGLWTSREFRNGLGIGGGARYVSRQFIAPDNAFEIDGYVRLDAVFSYRLENWRLSLNFKNLTNREYETRGFGSSSVIPADGFGAFGTIQFTM